MAQFATKSLDTHKLARQLSFSFERPHCRRLCLVFPIFRNRFVKEKLGLDFVARCVARSKSRRSRPLILAIAIGAACVGRVQAENARLILGGNINERFQWATPQVLEKTHTTWVRGFVPASEFLSGKRSYQSDPGLEALRRAADSGRKTVLSIKWDSTGKGNFGRVPAPDSAAETAAFNFVDRLLDATDGRLSVLVVTNELLIDTLPVDLIPNETGHIPIVFFLRRLTEHIDRENRRAVDGGRLPLFAGGMTRLDTPQTQQAPATRAVIRWINSDSKVTGADFHLHQPGMPTTESALEFMHRAVPDKPLMITEMSLVFQWKAHLRDKIGASRSGRAFAVRYTLPPAMTVAQFLTACFQRPVPEDEWHQFLASQAWFEGHYLANVVPLLQANGVQIATYAVTWNPDPGQAPAPEPVTPKTTPWFMNPLLVPGLADISGSGRLPENYQLFTDYVSYQHHRSRSDE
jgi:hypothetical protein